MREYTQKLFDLSKKRANNEIDRYEFRSGVKAVFDAKKKLVDQYRSEGHIAKIISLKAEYNIYSWMENVNNSALSETDKQYCESLRYEFCNYCDAVIDDLKKNVKSAAHENSSPNFFPSTSKVPEGRRSQPVSPLMLPISKRTAEKRLKEFDAILQMFDDDESNKTKKESPKTPSPSAKR